MKTDIDIKKWVYSRIKGSVLDAEVTGKLSDRGRPNGSEEEDVVISVLANEGCGQVQQAYVNINIYVRDLWNDGTKAWEADTVRIRRICDASKFLFNMYGEGFMVFPSQCTQRVLLAGITYEDGHTEHLVNNKIYIKISND